jgi:hypothetical protein
MTTMFQSPGWAYLTDVAIDQSAELDRHLAKETDAATWKLLRGQKIQADWLIQLPEEIADKAKKCRRAYAEMMAEFKEGQSG